MLELGIAKRNIMPDGPGLVQGQKYVRIATEAQDPITATAMALKGRRADGGATQAIVISIDISMISDELERQVRAAVVKRVPGLAPESIVLLATHTHDSITVVEGGYPDQGPGVLSPTECVRQASVQAADAAVEAWEKTKAVKIGRALGHAVVAHNRRPVYADGSAQMYGTPTRKDFRWIEGAEDHTLDIFFVWDGAGKLEGIVLNVPCPSQADEHLTKWSADFWHEIRIEVDKRIGKGVWVFPMCGNAGDCAPHPIVDRPQEAELLARRGVTKRQEIADRVVDGVVRALSYTKPTDGDVVFEHVWQKTEFPARKITQADRDWHAAEYQRSIKEMDPRLWWPTRMQQIVDIFDGKIPAPTFTAEIHAFRIGDAAWATNPFELYVDYGYQIKARSTAAQTFLSQLTGPYGMYLPTQRGVDGGGYGALPASSRVGPEGGQQLVELTVELIQKLFPVKK